MIKPIITRRRAILAAVLSVLLVAGVVVMQSGVTSPRTRVVAYFQNSNGIFAGDDVRIIGIPVGKIEAIEPQPQRVKVTFWVARKYKVPADVNAVIISPSLVTARAIQLTPAYTGGPTMHSGAVIPESRTAVPVEWDDLREQLEKLTETLQPTEPGGVSTLGAFVNTAADNLRGQGASIRDTIIKLSQAFTALGEHSNDIFSSVKNLATLVSALESSADLMAQLNGNLAAVTGALADAPDEVGRAVSDLNSAITDVESFVSENREPLGTTFDKLTSVTTAVNESLYDVKQALHVLPTTATNLVNLYHPSKSVIAGILAAANFSNPLMFLCGAVQAASRLGGDQAAKLCVQYLAPIVKNRQYNFPPLGVNPFVAQQARPNELTYSEDWLRPDSAPPPAPAPMPPSGAAPGQLPAEAPAPLSVPAASEPAQRAVSTDPAAGLQGMMLPPGGGS